MPDIARRAAFGLFFMMPLQARANVFAEGGVALRGQDVVGYFTQRRVLRGVTGHMHEWAGARWLFASEANRARFAADPVAHMPAYGGFCAWAVAQGYTAPTDPEAWRIVDGRLYLNYDLNIRRRWERDVPGNIARGDVNWPRLSAV